MKYFINFEFHEHFVKPSIFSTRKIHTIEPIEVGIVCEDGRYMRALYKDFDTKAAWNHQWLRENVLRLMYHRDENSAWENFDYNWFRDYIATNGLTKRVIAEKIKQFCQTLEPDGMFNITDTRSAPEFWAYFADYDWICLCQTFGTMMDLPVSTGFPMYCNDLKQELDRRVEVKRLLSKPDTGSVRMSHEKYLEYVKKLKEYPKQNIEHDPVADAEWNFKLYQFLHSL